MSTATLGSRMKLCFSRLVDRGRQLRRGSCRAPATLAISGMC